MSRHSRRSFLQSTSALLGAAAFTAPFESFAARLRAAEKARHATDFGKLAPVKDKTTGLPLIQLPDGFEYLTFGWEKEKLTDGGIMPSMHDGMAIIAHDENTVTLCRNHEVDGSGKAFGNPDIAYDPHATGGCTNLVFNTKDRELEVALCRAYNRFLAHASGQAPERIKWVAVLPFQSTQRSSIASCHRYSPLVCQ